jgi:hypothetical protein
MAAACREGFYGTFDSCNLPEAYGIDVNRMSTEYGMKFDDRMRLVIGAAWVLAAALYAVPAGAETPKLKSVEAVLTHYQQALGGVEAIRAVQSETRHAEAESSTTPGKTKLVFYAKPFKQLVKITRPDGREITSGFDGAVSWVISAEGASIDHDVPVESDRRDTDLQYALHQADYFNKLEFAGVTDFEGSRCYWLRGTTHWGKDNNQFYDVKTGLLAGYRFQQDAGNSAAVTTLQFKDYKSFGGPLIATKLVIHADGAVRTITIQSVSYEPLADELFELPAPVKALLKS